MSGKVVVIISSHDVGKARTGMMYAVNAVKHSWLSEVKLIFFGPAEERLLEDAEMQAYLKEYQSLCEPAVACKFLADRDGSDEKIAALGVEIRYVGKMISDYIVDGYTPMVW